MLLGKTTAWDVTFARTSAEKSVDDLGQVGRYTTLPKVPVGKLGFHIRSLLHSQLSHTLLPFVRHYIIWADAGQEKQAALIRERRLPWPELACLRRALRCCASHILDADWRPQACLSPGNEKRDQSRDCSGAVGTQEEATMPHPLFMVEMKRRKAPFTSYLEPNFNVQ